MEQTKVNIKHRNTQVLQVVFPRHKRKGSLYIGGAHGTLGLVYIIVQACLMNSQILTANEGTLELIKATYEDLLG